jgi:hypothetical protein
VHAAGTELVPYFKTHDSDGARLPLPGFDSRPNPLLFESTGVPCSPPESTVAWEIIWRRQVGAGSPSITPDGDHEATVKTLYGSVTATEESPGASSSHGVTLSAPVIDGWIAQW